MHEYLADAAQFAADIRAAGGPLSMVQNTYQSLLQLAQGRHGVAEHQLQDYL